MTSRVRSLHWDTTLLSLLVIFQGFALYVGSKPISLTLFAAWFWIICRALKEPTVRKASLRAYLLFGAVVLFVTFTNIVLGESPSIQGCLYLLVLYLSVSLIRGMPLNQDSSARVLDSFSTLMAALSVVGVCQLLFQAYNGIYLDYTVLPSSVVLDTYNTRIPISANSDLFRSNGFFLLEPSFLSKLSALAVVVEFTYRRRALNLVLLLTGILASVSGSGLLLLAMALPFLVRKAPKAKIMLLALPVGAAAYLGITQLFIDRLSEFSVSTSSAYIRFFAPYSAVLQGFGDFNILWGNGLGSLEHSVIGGYSFEKMSQDVTQLAYDVTLVKVLVEMGVIGLIGFVYFYVSTFVSSKIGVGFVLATVSIIWVTTGSVFLAPILLLIAYLTNAMEGRGEKDINVRNI